MVGEHEKAVKAVCWQKELGCVVSGGWDKQVKVWDTRTAKCQSTTEVPDKVPPPTTTTPPWLSQVPRGWPRAWDLGASRPLGVLVPRNE